MEGPDGLQFRRFLNGARSLLLISFFVICLSGCQTERTVELANVGKVTVTGKADDKYLEVQVPNGRYLNTLIDIDSLEVCPRRRIVFNDGTSQISNPCTHGAKHEREMEHYFIPEDGLRVEDFVISSELLELIRLESPKRMSLYQAWITDEQIARYEKQEVDATPSALMENIARISCRLENEKIVFVYDALQ